GYRVLLYPAPNDPGVLAPEGGRVLSLRGEDGAAVFAAEMARRGRGATLILVSPYTSITEMARRTLPVLPAAWLCPDHYDTLSKASGIAVPTIVIHGDEDEVVPFAMGQAVSEAIHGATLHVVKGGHHNDLFAGDRYGLVSLVVESAKR
ncbi:MAG TPA: alpha/beta hydrolase, partial [Polyangiaceae bacterium]